MKIKYNNGAYMVAPYEIIVGETVDMYIAYDPHTKGFRTYKKAECKVEDRGLNNGETKVTVSITPLD